MDLSAFEQYRCFLNEGTELRALQFSTSLKVRLLGLDAHSIIRRKGPFIAVDRLFRQSSHLMRCRICTRSCTHAPLDSGASRQGLNGSEPPS